MSLSRRDLSVSLLSHAYFIFSCGIKNGAPINEIYSVRVYLVEMGGEIIMFGERTYANQVYLIVISLEPLWLLK